MKNNLCKILTCVLIAVISFTIGYQFSLNKYSIKDYKTLTYAINIIKNNYVNEISDEQFTKGLVSGIGDPFSVYFNQKEYQSFETQMSNNYVGIGVIISKTDDKVKIIKILKNSPAEKAQIKEGTEIISINDKPITGLDLDGVSALIRGPINSKLTIKVMFENTTRDINLIREKIMLVTVEGKMLTQDIAYIRILTFNFGTDEEFTKILNSQLTKKPKALILDLRDNGGGILEVTTNIAKRFLKNNSILFYTAGRDKKEEPTYITNANPINIPVLVIVNKLSASASEVLAGSIVDNKIGKLVGEKTYGKATIQKIFDIPINNGAIKLTVQKYLTPSKFDLNKNGLTPEYLFTDLTISEDPINDKVVIYSMNLFNK
jgi:carboxyl-terminal processing protease